MFNAFKFLRRDRRVNIAGARNKIAETIHVPTKSGLVGTAIERVDGEIRRVDDELADLKKYENALAEHPGHDHGAAIESRGNRTLGWTFTGAGFLTQYAVNHGALPHWSVPSTIILSAGVEAGFYAIGRGAVHSLNNRIRPAATIRVAKGLALGLSGTVVAAAITAGYIRLAGADTSTTFFDIAAAAAWWIAEIAPVTAGLWVGLANLRDHPREVVDDIRTLTEYKDDLTKFRLWLAAELARIKPKPVTPTPTTPGDAARGDDDEEQPGAAAAMKLAIVALAFVTLAGSASAQVCGLASDRSLLGNSSARQQAIGSVVNHLDDFTARFGCRTLVATSFTDAGAYSARVALNVPQRGIRRDCSTVEAPPMDKAHAMLGGVAAYDDHRRAQEREKCVVDEARRDSIYTIAWTKFIGDVRAVAAADAVTAPTRVDITGVLQGFADAGVKDVLVISPGFDSGIGIPEHLRGTGAVIFVTYLLADGFGGRSVTDAAAERWRRAGAVVVPYTALSTPQLLLRIVLPASGG